MPLCIIRNDITRIAADAIVNTANPEPVVGAGTDAAIHAAAGPELLEARRRIGRIAPGCAAATDAFGLPARYVLHTVSPCWSGGTRQEAALLRQAYDAALALADQLQCRSVAFPLMAAGSYGFPNDLALSIAIQAITDHLMQHDRTVYLVLFNASAFGLASTLFADLKSYIDDNYVAEKTAAEFSAPRRERRPAAPFRPGKARRESEEQPAPPAAAMGSAAFPDAAEMREEAAASFAFNAPAKAADSLEALLKQSEATFSEHLRGLLMERGGKDSEVYKRAEISKQLFSKILSTKEYQPTKSTAVQLAIGLQLDLNQTQKLLETAGYALTRSSKADLVVQYYIERKIYSVTFINEALSDCALPLLKTGLKA